MLRTFTILPTEANATMQVIHTRMPVILEEADWNAWLDPETAPLPLLRPAAEGVVHIWPVSRAVNNMRNNGTELLDRIDDPNAAAK